MSVETARSQPSQPSAVEWTPPMPPTDLVFDDGEPLESNRHRIATNVLIRSMRQGWGDRDDYFVGGNMFVYYSRQQARNRDFRGPDFFAVLDVDGTRDRQGWVVWEENGRYPDIIIELMSPLTAEVDTGVKREIYERTFRTPNYYVYDPFDPNSLQGWYCDATQRYRALTPNDRGWLWCERLGWWVGIWNGTIETVDAPWLRFYDRQGNLIPLPEEAARQQAQQERQRAEAAERRAETADIRAARRQLLRLLSLRFETVPEVIETCLQPLTLEQLERLIEIAIAAESIENFRQQLDDISS